MSFKTDLIVKSHTNYKWQLVEPLYYYFDEKHKDYGVRVPEGFVTDFATVPRAIWSIIPPIGKYTKAAVLHDYLYENPHLVKNKKEADKIFLHAMEILGVEKWKRTIMYWSVRAFGKGKF